MFQYSIKSYAEEVVLKSIYDGIRIFISYFLTAAWLEPSDLRSRLAAVVPAGVCWCLRQWSHNPRAARVSSEMFLYVEEREGDRHLQGRFLYTDPKSHQHQHPGKSLSHWWWFHYSISGSGSDQQCFVNPRKGRLLLPGPDSPAGHFPLPLQSSQTQQILLEKPDQPGQTQPEQQQSQLHPQSRLQCRHRVEVRMKRIIKTSRFDLNWKLQLQTICVILIITFSLHSVEKTDSIPFTYNYKIIFFS